MDSLSLSVSTQCLIVFAVSILTEGAYTAYAYFAARADKIKTPIFSGLIAVGKGVLVYIYSRNALQIATLAVGQMIGTWITLTVITKTRLKDNLS